MSNYKKIRCPNCGATREDFGLKRNCCEYRIKCPCPGEIYCSIHERYICRKTGVIFTRNGSTYHGTCEDCDQDNDDCDVHPNNCVPGDDGDYKRIGDYCYLYCCTHFDLCCDDDENGGCSYAFYFHPILRKAIYCPECGDFDVDTTKEKNIWDFKCNNCGHEFSLRKNNKNKNKNNNNKKNPS